MTTRSIVGFDSAWTDKPNAPGAVCVLRAEGTGWAFNPPELCRFSQALEAIQRERDQSDYCLVAIDQPTIVPNVSGSRPVDKLAASVISYVGGGVQPANRSKLGMFDDGAPIWQFKTALGATEDPELARSAAAGLYIMEVFPAFALPSIEARFYGRHAAARYNPANRKKFQHEHWLAVITAVERFAAVLGVGGAADWCHSHRNLVSPRKAHQDLLDAVICALIALHWLVADRSASMMIGAPETGYMVTPVSSDVRTRIENATSRLRIAP